MATSAPLLVEGLGVVGVVQQHLRRHGVVEQRDEADRREHCIAALRAAAAAARERGGRVRRGRIGVRELERAVDVAGERLEGLHARVSDVAVTRRLHGGYTAA